MPSVNFVLETEYPVSHAVRYGIVEFLKEFFPLVFDRTQGWIARPVNENQLKRWQAEMSVIVLDCLTQYYMGDREQAVLTSQALRIELHFDPVAKCLSLTPHVKVGTQWELVRYLPIRPRT